MSEAEAKKKKPTEEELAEMEDKVQETARKLGAEVAVFRAPEDPEEKRKWAERMTKLHIQISFVGAKCAYCGHIYTSVDDFIERNPRSGYDEDRCVCDKCWKAYDKKVKKDGSDK